jgi:hypothetical protein
LQTLAASIRSSSLSTLTLPKDLTRLYVDIEKHSVCLMAIAEACRSKGVEVLWDDSTEERPEAGVNERFWRWVKENKAKSSA